MSFCRICGQKLEDDAKFCPACGTAAQAQAEQQAQPNTEQQAQTNATAQSFQTVPPVDDVNSNRGIAWLADLGLFLLIPLLARKNSKYCEFHVRQGFVLFAFYVAYSIVARSMHFVFGIFWYNGNPFGFPLGVLFSVIFDTVFGAGYVFLAVISIMGIVNAAKGRENKLPVIGGIKLLDPVVDAIYRGLRK